MLQIIRKAVSGYGMFIGFLAQIKLLGKNSFDTNEITLGYPNSNEKYYMKVTLLLFQVVLRVIAIQEQNLVC